MNSSQSADDGMVVMDEVSGMAGNGRMVAVLQQVMVAVDLDVTTGSRTSRARSSGRASDVRTKIVRR